LHQEDYCQALGKPPSAKYESNQTGIRGPTLKDMFDITRRHMPPTEVAAMPAGDHEVLDQARQAVERRARQLLTQLLEFDDKPSVKVTDEEAGHTNSEVVVPQTQ
jgi:hypothetical protein